MKFTKIPIKLIVVIIVLAIFIPLLIVFWPNVIKKTYVDFPPISFSQNQYSNVKESSDIKLLFVGDVMFARNIGSAILNGENPFINVKNKFNEYDLVIGNLETTASEEQYAIQNPNKLYTFNAPVQSLDLLTENNISVVSLANNHTMDYGANALVNTLDNLKNRGVLYVGAGSSIQEAFAPKYLYVKKTKIALLAFNDIENWVTNVSESSAGSAYFDQNLIKLSLEEAEKNSDVVIVFPHWGIEYSLNNSDRQAEYARFFIDNGADIVIGAHPHVLQNVDEYNNKKIYYSLGNFVFDQMCEIENACNAGMVEVNITDNKISNSSLLKVKLADNGYPSLE